MRRWGVALFAIAFAACSSNPSDDAVDVPDDISPSVSPTTVGTETNQETVETQPTGTGSDVPQPAEADALEPAEVEQAFIAYARCLAADAEHLRLRFRVEPLYGVLKEIGVNDPTGQREDELDRRCTEQTGIDAIISTYQAVNPARPEQVEVIVDDYKSCLASIASASTFLETVATLDDITVGQAELLGAASDQTEGQLVIDCTETALYGPLLDTESLG